MSIEPDWENILFEARVAITDNPRFNEWYGTLTPLVRQILDEILDHDITPSMICLAQECSEEDWEKNMFIQALGNGNPSPTAANDLTDVVLGLVPWRLG